MNLTDFFNYTSPYRTDIWMELTNVEWLLPIAIIIVIGILIVKYREVFKRNNLVLVLV